MNADSGRNLSRLKGHSRGTVSRSATHFASIAGAPWLEQLIRQRQPMIFLRFNGGAPAGRGPQRSTVRDQRPAEMPGSRDNRNERAGCFAAVRVLQQFARRQRCIVCRRIREGPYRSQGIQGTDQNGWGRAKILVSLDLQSSRRESLETS